MRTTASFPSPSSSSCLSSLDSESDSDPSTPIPPPPPISMPVWSLAAPWADGETTQTSMNIMTFCMPVSVAAPKLWILSLYQTTLTHQAFLQDSSFGVLQLLAPHQAPLVPLLGKQSGKSFDKRQACAAESFGWLRNGQSSSVKKNGDQSGRQLPFLMPNERQGPSLDLLPECSLYIQLKVLNVTYAGDHDAALCQVEAVGRWDASIQAVIRVENDDSQSLPPLDPQTALYTAQLREEGYI